MVEKGKRYRFRLINAFTTNCFTEFSIENHELLIIAQDDTNVEPISVNTITTGAGERVDFIINATGDVKSYWIQVGALGLCRMNKVQQLAILEYQGQLHEPEYQNPLPRGLVYNPANATCRGILNDTICPSDFKSLDEIDSDLLKVKPDIRYVMPFSFHFFNTEGACNYFYSSNTSDFMRFIVPLPEFTVMGSMDDVVFKSPPAPPLTQSEGYADSCDGKNSPICEKFKEPTPCVCTNIKLIPLDSVVEVILYDQAPLVQLPHPFHLHGHQFQLFDIGRFVDKRVVSREDMQIIIDEHDERLSNGFYDLRQPPKDTVLFAQSGWVLFRFKANNPGVWMLHCHLDFHHAVGMAVMFKVGEAEDLPPIPPNFPRCGDFKPTVDYHEKKPAFSLNFTNFYHHLLDKL